MVEVVIYPRYLSFRQTRDGPVIQIFGTTDDGKVICAIDRRFRPHFYVVPAGDKDKAAEALRAVSIEEPPKTYRVREVVEEERSFFGKPMMVLRVSFDDAWGTFPLAMRIRAMEEVDQVFEADLPFEQYYALRQGILPYEPLRIDGEWINFRSRVSVIEIKSLSSSPEDELEHFSDAYLIIEPQPQPDTLEGTPTVGIKRAWLRHGKERILITTERQHGDYSQQIVCENQKEIVENIKELITSWKPGLLIGWKTDIEGFPLLDALARQEGVTLDMGLDLSNMRLGKRKDLYADIVGIEHIDLMNVMSRIFRENVFSLKELYQRIIGEDDISEPIDQLSSIFPLIFPILRQLSKVTGLTVQDLVRVPRSRFLDHHLMVQMDRDWLIPPRQSHQMVQDIDDKPLFELGKSCLKQTVYLTDLAPLIRKVLGDYNISKETLWCTCCKDDVPSIMVETLPYPVWFCRRKKGIMPEAYGNIVQRLERIRSMGKKGTDLSRLEARFKAINILIDRFLTYFGARQKRYASIVCAEVLKELLRRELEKMAKQAIDYGIEMIMADQQYLFFADHDMARSIEDTEEAVNQLFAHRLGLRLQGPHERVIFIATEDFRGKKRRKYAYLKDGKLVTKRFTLPNTLFASFSDMVIKDILRQVLNGESSETVKVILLGHIEKLMSGLVAKEDLIFHARLQKDLDSYESTPPHVAAALRMKGQGYKVIKGMEISFMIGPGSEKISDRVKLPWEGGEIDLQYYVYNQILPQLDELLGLMGIDLKEMFNTDQERLSTYLERKRQKKRN